jgi:hypothetical protein
MWPHTSGDDSVTTYWVICHLKGDLPFQELMISYIGTVHILAPMSVTPVFFQKAKEKNSSMTVSFRM